MLAYLSITYMLFYISMNLENFACIVLFGVGPGIGLLRRRSCGQHGPNAVALLRGARHGPSAAALLLDGASARPRSSGDAAQTEVLQRRDPNSAEVMRRCSCAAARRLHTALARRSSSAVRGWGHEIKDHRCTCSDILWLVASFFLKKLIGSFELEETINVTSAVAPIWTMVKKFCFNGAGMTPIKYLLTIKQE